MSNEYIAVESYSRVDGWVTEEYLPQLTSLQGKRTMKVMLDDATFSGIMFILRAVFRGVEWTVALPEDAKDDEQYEEKRRYLEHALFHDIGDYRDPTSFATFDDMVQMALDMLPWGYALISPWFKKRPDGYVGIRRLIQIAPETVYEWQIEEPLGNVVGVIQERPATFKDQPIPSTDYIHFKTEPYKGSPEGRSVFRGAYKSWYRRDKLQQTEAILAERGTGFPVVYYNRELVTKANNGDKAAAESLKAIRTLPSKIRQNEQSGLSIGFEYMRDADGKLTSNKDIEFEFSPVSTTNQVDMRAAIKDYDFAIARSVMAQFMFNGSETGNRALDKSQTSTFLKAVNGFAEIIAGVINRQLVTKMWAMNGWSDDDYMPFIVPSNIEKASLEEVGRYVQSLASSGAPIFPDEQITEYLMNLAGIPWSQERAESEEF